MELVRKNCGIILALFRWRLNTKYCGSNRRLQHRDDDNINSWGGCYDYSYYQCHGKYQTALAKGNCLEFRVPSKFESVKQMMRRYELFYELVNFSVNNRTGKHDAFLKKIKPIIVAMYEGNEVKANEVLTMAKSFRKFILDGTISNDIEQYLK